MKQFHFFQYKNKLNLNMEQELNQSQAVNVLIQAARIAQSKGAFTLEDAELVSKAIKVFTPASSQEDGVDPVVNQTEHVVAEQA
jgi:hypothetical protein